MHAGSQSPQVTLAILSALSGMSTTPVSVRVEGNQEGYALLGTFVERLIGPKRSIYLTSGSESGFMGLGAQDELAVLIFEGIPSDKAARNVILRKIANLPVRTIDAPLGNEMRTRSFDRPISVLLLGTDDLDDAKTANKALILRFANDNQVRQLRARRRLEIFRAGAKRESELRSLRMERLQRAVNSIDWLRPIEDVFRCIDETAIADASAAERVSQVIALAAIVQRFITQPRKSTGVQGAVLPLSKKAIGFVVRLLNLAGTKNVQTSLTAAEQKTSHIIRLYLERKGDTKASFTIKGIRGLGAFASLTKSSIHDRINGLEQKNHIHRLDEKSGRQLQWQFTEQGLAHKDSPLAALIEHHFPGSGDLAEKDRLLGPILRTIQRSCEVRQLRHDNGEAVPKMAVAALGDASENHANFGRNQNHA